MDVRKLAGMKPPLLESHPATWALLRYKPVYDSDADGAGLFDRALAENGRWHFAVNPLYRQFCQASNGGLDEYPVLGAEVFKWHDLGVCREPILTVSSSGTGGRATTMPLDAETIIRMWAMGRAVFEAEALITDTPANYLIFAPDPQVNQARGNPHFFSSLAAFAPARETVYALQPAADGGLRFAVGDVLAALTRFAATGMPVRILGLPAVMMQAARQTAAGSIRLPPQSLVLTGGGCKQEVAPLPKPAFRALLQQAWGIPDDRIRDLYGMTESAVHFLECSAHSFHVPVFARVRIVDPLTRAQMAAGNWGVLHLANPGFTSLPTLSLLTADVGREVKRCPCGNPTMAFEVAGRGGTAQRRGCAATTLASLKPDGPTLQMTTQLQRPTVLYEFGQWREQEGTVPVLSALLERARQCQPAIRALSVAKVCAAIGNLRTLWTTDGVARKAYLRTQPEFQLGISREMVEWGLDYFVDYLDANAAKRRLEHQLGALESLDERVEPLGTILHIVAGNIFIGPVESLLAGLLTRNVNLVKTPRAASTFLTAFVRSLEHVAPELGAAVALLEWPGGDAAIERSLMQGVDAVLVAGDSEAISTYQHLAGGTTRLLEYGPRVSVAVIVGKEFTESDADNLALDVGLWDQFACTSAQCVFVRDRAAAQIVAQQLAASLARLASVLPEGEATLDERIDIARVRQRAQFASSVSDQRLWASSAGLWTVVFDPEPRFEPSPLRRCVRVMPYSSLDELAAALAPAASLLQTVGLHGVPALLEPLTHRLTELGARRFCNLGQMNQPAPDEPHDGTLELQQFVRNRGGNHE
jgi:hypothetical protein